MIIPYADELVSIRTNDLSEPLDLYLKIADKLAMTQTSKHQTRATFIRLQCEGLPADELFNEHREEWGITYFDEDLVTVNDFKRGFLWCFRDHTTSWNEDQEAKQWFLTSPEAIFVRRYEFWSCDNGHDKCVETREGSYKEILLSLLKDADYSVLASTAFSRKELEHFIDNFEEADHDFSLEEIIEDYISENPNYEED